MDESYDDLWDVKWIPIPGEKYIMKYNFYDDGYSLLVTNLSEIYGEKLSEKEVLERFCLVNPYAEMKPKVIISKVKQTLENNVTPQNMESEMKMQCFSGNLKLRLQFTVSQISFLFDLNPKLLTAESLRTHVIAPTVLSSFLSFQENNDLRKKLDVENNSSPQKTRIDPKTSKALSSLSKKSKVNVEDILESFLQSQKNMLKYIDDSKNHVDKTLESVVIEKKEALLPNKRELDSEESNSMNIKYEDKDSIIIKEEENPGQSVYSNQTNSKIKKKKTFKI